eukprot:1079421-Prorocentrum_minimum.AAC.2
MSGARRKGCGRLWRHLRRCRSCHRWCPELWIASGGIDSCGKRHRLSDVLVLWDRLTSPQAGSFRLVRPSDDGLVFVHQVVDSVTLRGSQAGHAGIAVRVVRRVQQRNCFAQRSGPHRKMEQKSWPPATRRFREVHPELPIAPRDVALPYD